MKSVHINSVKSTDLTVCTFSHMNPFSPILIWMLLAMSGRLTVAYPSYKDAIPNGNNVPSPCKSNETWTGVGHKLQLGSGARNNFGHDFAESGKEWSKSLCEKDSDLDGRTNGQELGDPNCTWSQGMPDPNGSHISHPGVCEPWNDPKCLSGNQSWILDICQPKEFQCDAIREPDVQNYTLQIPRTKVPASETTYMCQIFDLPDETDNHIIANTPLIDNTEVLHHMIIFGCEEDIPASTEPFPCGMVPNYYCQSILGLWAPGVAGNCQHSAVGIRTGVNGTRKLALQLHWNNPQLRADYFDSSGMIIYYTSTLRPNDAGILTTGQEKLLIPPGESSVVAEATCPSDCTQSFLFDTSIYITEAGNHMHYLGIRQSLELYRNGEKVRDIAVDENYNYDNPQLYTFEDPIEVRPGDEIKTRCEYSSTGLSHTTQYGAATSDEMCYSFITYYPRHPIKSCTSLWSIPLCRLHDGSDKYEGCQWGSFPNIYDPEIHYIITELWSNCKLFEECNQNCYNTVQSLKQHNCLRGDIWKYITAGGSQYFHTIQGVEFLLRFRSCDCGISTSAEPTFPAISEEESVCDWPGLLTGTASDLFLSLFHNVTSKCSSSGVCFKECIPATKDAKNHHCFQSAEWHYGRNYLYQSENSKALEFLLKFQSCNCEIFSEPTSSTPAATTEPTTSSSNILSTSILVLFPLVSFLL